MIRSLLCLSLTLFLLGEAAQASPKKELLECIKRYNRNLIEAAADPSFTENFDNRRRLEECATKKVAQKLYIWIASWHENRLYMEAKLEKLELIRLNRSQDSAIAETKEIWIYRYKKIDSEGRVSAAHPPSKMEYLVRYTLKKFPKGWKIAQIKILHEKETPLPSDTS